MNKKAPCSEKHGLSGLVDVRTFLPLAVVMVVLIVIGILSPVTFGETVLAIRNFISRKFGWWYSLVMIAMAVFSLWLLLNPKVANIRFGGEDAKPEYSFFTWAAITLTSGAAIGILFYGVAEPMGYFASPPVFSGWEGGSVAAAENALKYAYFHWLNPYVVYGAIGTTIGYMYWNCGKRYKISSSLYPLIGDRCDQKAGSWLNGICLFATIAGITTSFGHGILQISTGIQYVFGVHLDVEKFYLVLIIGYTALFSFAACSGMKRAISFISNTDSCIYFALLLLVLLIGGAGFILNNTVTSVGKYLEILIPQSFYLEPAYNSGWVADNTIFFWAWALSGCPVMCLFMIKMAKGRTIRQFITVNMLIPMAFVVLWFGFFGSAGLNQELNHGGGLLSAIDEYGTAAAMFALVKNLKHGWVLMVFVFLALIFSFITLFQSMTLTLADMTSAKVLSGTPGAQSPMGLRVFWGILMGAMAYILLLSGGLSTIQAISIIFALPFSLLLIAMVISFLKAIHRREEYECVKQ